MLAAPLRGAARVIWARSFNHIGPGQGAERARGRSGRCRSSAPSAPAAGRVRAGRLDVVRDFLDVRDVADAYLALVFAPAACGAVNVCSGPARRAARSVGRAASRRRAPRSRSSRRPRAHARRRPAVRRRRPGPPARADRLARPRSRSPTASPTLLDERSRAGAARRHAPRCCGWTSWTASVSSSPAPAASSAATCARRSSSAARASSRCAATRRAATRATSPSCPPTCARDRRSQFGDVRDRDFVGRLVAGADAVFNLAASISVPYSFVAPREVVMTNVEGTLNVLAGRRDARRRADAADELQRGLRHRAVHADRRAAIRSTCRARTPPARSAPTSSRSPSTCPTACRS